MLLAPAAILASALRLSPTIVFVAAFLSLIPLASLLGEATEELALRTGEIVSEAMAPFGATLGLSYLFIGVVILPVAGAMSEIIVCVAWRATILNSQLSTLNHAQLNCITRHVAQIVLENLSGDGPLNIVEGTMLAAEHLPKRSHVGLIAARLKPQALRQEPAQPVKGQILLRLHPLPAKQKKIKRFIPVIAIEQMLPQIQKHVPRVGGCATKQILDNLRSVVPPGLLGGRTLSGFK